MEEKINEPEKEKKSDINYSLYAENPEKLFPIAQEQFNKNNFEEGIDILEQSILLAVKKFGGEEKIELVQFYHKYADGILQKLLYSNNDFLNVQEDEEIGSKNKEEEPKEEKEKDKEKDKEKEKEKEKNIEEEKVQKQGDNLGDDEIVYDNLNAANLLLKNYLKEYDDKDPKTLSQDVIKYYLLLSDNYSLFALLEKSNSDFKKSNEYYKQSIDIAKKYGDKFSRNLAGLFFEQAQILDFDPHTCLLSLYKSKVIMEYYVQKEIDKAGLNIKLDIDENDLDLTELSFSSDKVNKNKDTISNNAELIKISEDNFDIKEFIDIIKDINLKIEDVILELKEYDLFLKTKEKMKKDEEKQNCFDTNIDMSKVVDLKSVTLIKKKRKEPANNDDDIKKPEEGSNKEKKIE